MGYIEVLIRTFKILIAVTDYVAVQLIVCLLKLFIKHEPVSELDH